MTLLTVLVLVALGAAAAAVAVGVAVGRGRDRRNRVVPEVPTEAPASWAGTHTPVARLHRRLRDAVLAGRAVSDPDGSLIAARVEVERTALAVDNHLIAVAALSERERSDRMAQVTAAVSSVEHAAAKLADAANLSSGGAMEAVEAVLERARLLDQARRELDTDPAAILDDLELDVETGMSSDGDGQDPTPRASTG